MAECGLLSLATCLPQKFFEYIESFLNAPLQPLLDMVNGLLTAQVNLQLFASFWAIIIYILSIFYAFLIMYSGIMFLISGHDIVKREQAKDWLKNILIMIILVQTSFFIYELVVLISSALTSATLGLIAENYFKLQLDSIGNIALAMILYLYFIIVLLITAILLVIRYALVAIGIVLFPISIFCYFIPPLRSYGTLILNILGVSIFITFIDAIFLAGFSKLVEQPIFADMKIIVITSSFTLINGFMILIFLFAVIRAANYVNAVGGSIASLFTKFK